MTTKSFMSNLVKIEDTGNSNYLSNIRYAAGATFDSIFLLTVLVLAILVIFQILKFPQIKINQIH